MTPVGNQRTVGNVSRRSVLRSAGIGAATVAVAGVGVGSYRVFDNGVLNAGDGTPYDPWSNWLDDRSPLGIVAAAILAANPHNSQPWKFHVTDKSIEMFADASRRTGSLDPLGREHHIGLGCALENVVLSSIARGHRPTVVMLPDRVNKPVALVDLAPGGANVVSALHDAINSRHSNRGPFTNAAIPPQILSDLAGAATAAVGELDGARVRWFTTNAERTAFGALLNDATLAIVEDDEQSKDSFAWFRNDRDSIEKHNDGLTLDVQGLSRLKLSAAKIFPATSRPAGDRFWLNQTRTVHTATAAAYGVVTVADPVDLASRLIGGRYLQRLHLAATVRGLGLHHMNQITERIDREASLSMRPTFAAKMDEVLSEPGRRPLCTFRLGYPVRPGALSPRRSVMEVAM